MRLRYKSPTFRIQFLAGVLVLLSVLLALPGTAHAGRDVRAGDGVPPEPTELGVGVEPGALEVGVSWDDVPGATSYSLNWRRPGGDFGPGRAREVALVQEPTETGARDPATSTLTLTGACTEITITVLSFEAAYTSTFMRFVGGTGTSLGITNNDVGTTVVLSSLPAGELVLGIRVQETGHTFKTGPASSNPDGLIHARISGSTVYFEDWFGGGDEDFDDAVLRVTQANCEVSPPPVNTQPENTETTQPENTEPENTEPETTDPETTDPETTDPETTDPETTDPETTDPETTDPETTDPETTELENTEPDDTQTPPPDNTGSPPPEETETNPPENTGTPPLETAGTNPAPGGSPGGIPGDGAEGTPDSTESEEPVRAEACGSSVLPVPPPGGWTYGASDTADLAALMAAQRFPVASVWLFDIDAQKFRGHTVGAPDLVNTLDDSVLRPGSIVIMRRTDAPGGVTEGEAPVAEEEPAQDGPTVLPVPPPGGWTYGLACTSDLEALIAVQQFTVVSVWLFKADAQRFLSHTVGLPDVVNSLDDSMLTPGSVVMMRRGDVVPVAEPHEFYGSAAAGSGPTLDGELVADGTVIIAWDQDGEALRRAAVAGGDWVIDVSEGEAARVAFSIEGSEHSAPYDVVSGARTEVALAFGSPDIGDGAGDDADTGLPGEDDRADDAPGDEDDAAAGDGDDAGPSDGDDPAPGDADDAGPGDEDDAGPGDEDDAAPGDEDDAASRDDGDAAPGDDGDVAAEDDGDVAAEDDGDVAAADDGDVAAADEGDTAAADEGDTAAADDEAAPGPTALPNTGSGGLGGGGLPVLPVALAVALTLGLAATALVRRSRP